jgi:predicted PurR-regulated permease PerM
MRRRQVPKALAAILAVAIAVAILAGFLVLLLRTLVLEADTVASEAAAGGDEIRRWLTDTTALDEETAKRIFSSIAGLLKELASFLGSGIVGAVAFLGQLVTIFFLA